MTLTVDEQIEIGLADNKILLFRFDAHLRKEVYKRLNTMQKRLLSHISAVGIESISQKALKQLLKDVSDLVDETYQDIHQVTAKDLKALLPLQAEALTKIYNQAVKFDLFNQVPDYRIKAIRNAEIIAGAPLEDWWRKQGDNLTFDFERTIRSGMIEGASYNDLVKSVKEITGRSRRGAETLVRTAVMKVNDAAHEALRDENEDLLNGEQHVSTLDTRTSEICRLRDGLSWDMEQQPIGGHKIPYKRPPLHPNCRSDLKLLIKSWKELGINLDEIPESTKASLDGQVKSSMNYEDWLKTKSEAEQDKILGKGKAKLWRDGVITFRDMLDQSGRPLTLKELSEIYHINREPLLVKSLRIAGVKADNPMSFEEANSGNVNPNYNKNEGYRINCQTCVPVFEARLRGYNVQALPNIKGSMSEKLSHQTNLIWIDPKTGEHPRYIFDHYAKTAKKYVEFIDSVVKQGERYSIEFFYKNRGSLGGHIMNLDRTKEGLLRLKENQVISGRTEWLGDEIIEYFKQANVIFHDPKADKAINIALKIMPDYDIGKQTPVPKLLRIDNMEFDLSVADQIMVAKE